jgi:hypothetical protein
MGVIGQLQAPAALTLEEELRCTHWMQGWIRPKIGLHMIREIPADAGN